MDWTRIGAAAVAAFIIWILYKQRGGIKKLMQQSQEAPQHWGTYVFLMLMVIALVLFLLKI